MSTVSSIIERKKQQIEVLENKNKELLEENHYLVNEWIKIRDNTVGLMADLLDLEMQKITKIKIPKLNLKDLGKIVFSGLLMMGLTMFGSLIALGTLKLVAGGFLAVGTALGCTIGRVKNNFNKERMINAQRELDIGVEINNKELEIAKGDNEVTITKQSMIAIEKEYRDNQSKIALIKKDISDFEQTDIIGYNIGSQQDKLTEVATEKQAKAKRMGING